MSPKVGVAPLRREQIVRATIRCLARDGYAGLTMKKVARTAGVSQGILHYYFADKRAILVAALEMVMADLDRRVAAAQARGPRGPRARLRALITACLRLATEGREFLVVFVEFWGEMVHDRGLPEGNARPCRAGAAAGGRAVTPAGAGGGRGGGALRAPLSAGQAARAPLAGEWTIQEIVDHLVEPCRRGLDELWCLLAGRRPPGEPIPASLQSKAPLLRPWPWLLDELARIHAEVQRTLAAVPPDFRTAATAPLVMVVNVKDTQGTTTPLAWVEDLDWKSYAIVSWRLHAIDHLNQARKVLAAMGA